MSFSNCNFWSQKLNILTDLVVQDHLGPAILHELEKFPVHSLGLPSLLSDPSAKTSEEAVVHIFSEARRATPSILYIPQFNLWWDNVSASCIE